MAHESPEQFLQELDAGLLDGRLHETLETLHHDFLAEVAVLLAKRLQSAGTPK